YTIDGNAANCRRYTFGWFNDRFVGGIAWLSS
ncbi:MAG: hypothetical protein ACI952_002247, partial [Flavobacteriales bacterium]